LARLIDFDIGDAPGNDLFDNFPHEISSAGSHSRARRRIKSRSTIIKINQSKDSKKSNGQKVTPVTARLISLIQTRAGSATTIFGEASRQSLDSDGSQDHDLARFGLT
jgi:hypothetical protein